jgi:hypothetical protein
LFSSSSSSSRVPSLFPEFHNTNNTISPTKKQQNKKIPEFKKKTITSISSCNSLPLHTFCFGDSAATATATKKRRDWSRLSFFFFGRAALRCGSATTALLDASEGTIAIRGFFFFFWDAHFFFRN